MDKVTQQNAANAEESASASEELSAQAESMNEIATQLVTLVGGGAETSGKKRRQQPAPSPTKRALGKSDEMYHHIAGGPQKTTRLLERVLPLDDGNDGLEDFNG